MAQAKQSKKETPVSSLNVARFLPIVLTLLGIVAFFIFVLRPTSSAAQLKSAFKNTFSDMKSGRFNGSAGTGDPKVSLEFVGQYSGGDMTLKMVLSAKEKTATIDRRVVEGINYVTISGRDDLYAILKSYPGFQALQSDSSFVDGTWYRLSDPSSERAATLFPCIMQLPLPQQASGFADDTSFPFSITAGPFRAQDGSPTEVFQVKLIDHTPTYFEKGLQNVMTCLESMRADDYRLRPFSQSDSDVVRLQVTRNTLSGKITRIEYKQFNDYAVVNLSDFNKDVSIVAPEVSSEL
jgi:hypothetical protein